MPDVVTMACPVSIASRMLAEIVMRCHTDHPETTIEIREALREEVVNQIRFGVVDFGLASFMDPDDDLIVEALCDVAYHVVLPTGHPLAEHGTVGLAQPF